MKKLLVTGASGFLGWHVIHHAMRHWDVYGICLSHPVAISGASILRTDISRYPDLKKCFLDIMPDAVIHTAAISDPNVCEQTPAQTSAINTQASIHLAGLCAEADIPCVFTSTDLVFDGTDAPYTEDDTPCPVNHYGEQKVLAENGMKNVYPSTVICRLPLMFGDPGPVAKNYLQSLIRALSEGPQPKLFIDEYRTPISGRSAAHGLMIALQAQPPIIHLGGPTCISRYEFGCLVADVLGVPRSTIISCRQKDIEMPAKRPPDVCLDSHRANAMGFCPRPIREELECLLEVCRH
ncbi:dTDP-4-dehydrorhamnose reductase [Desulfosarcina variabilis str. Montpellier]|uniref:SDR family oxidoreductase n=1 Tax=Desulfosarcina variabilis TaxID=2300 RepID=UPI003AFABB6D